MKSCDILATDDLWNECAAAFEEVQRCKAIKSFVVQYGTRELERWKNHQQSIPLEQELGQAVHFIDSEAYDMMLVYSGDVVSQIWSVGFDADSADDPQGKWEFCRLLADQPRYVQAFQLIESALQKL